MLAWLEPTAKGEATVEWTGWLPLATGGDGVRLELPCLRVTSAESQDTTVHVIPGDQLALTERGLRNLTGVDAGRTKNEREYTAGGRTDYGGSWRVHTGQAAVRVYTVAGMRDRKLVFTAVVECQPAHGDVQALSVRVRDWAGEVRLEAPPTVRLRERRRGPDDRVWTLEQDPGVPGSLRVRLYGEQPAATAGAAAMPDVSVPGAGRVERWLGVAGPELTGAGASGLVPSAAPAGLDLPPEARRFAKGIGSIWRIESPEWRLNLAPADAASPEAPVAVYLAEYRASAAGGRWLHEAVYWLGHEANTDLNLTFPSDAEVLSVAVDGGETAPLQSEARRLWLPLTGRPAVCRVRVRWRYTAEDPARPDLAQPTLQGRGTARPCGRCSRRQAGSRMAPPAQPSSNRGWSRRRRCRGSGRRRSIASASPSPGSRAPKPTPPWSRPRGAFTPRASAPGGCSTLRRRDRLRPGRKAVRPMRRWTIF